MVERENLHGLGLDAVLPNEIKRMVLTSSRTFFSSLISVQGGGGEGSNKRIVTVVIAVWI